ncbi:MAG: hypothetical protein WBI82_16815 [Sphaerochaeta sp.]
MEQDSEHATVIIHNKQYFITLVATLGSTSHLKAPRQGNRERAILECVIGTVEVTLTKKDGTFVFRETGGLAGIELSEATKLQG